MTSQSKTQGSRQPKRSRSWSWRTGWSIALFVWGAALCQVRLFNLLAFEFALACTIPISFLGAYSAFKRAADLDDRSRRDVWCWWRDAAVDVCRIAWIPLIPITLNALRVKNCNWLDGIIFYLLLPMLSGVIASGWGVLMKSVALKRSSQSGQVISSTRWMRRGMISFTLLFVGAALWGLTAFFTTPCVDVFSTFIGYYPGALYDEEMMIGGRLALSRLEDLVWVVALLSLVSTQETPKLNSSRRLLIFGGLITVSVSAWVMDLHRPAWWVQRQLGGLKQSEHYAMHYPKEWSSEAATLLMHELEFNYSELSDFFKRAPQRKINVYFYQNARHKKRLMGAGNTLIAKPWQYSIHLHAPSVGDRVITHELAHVFSAEIAPAPHHLSLWRGVLPNMGLIEGLAVAAAWTRGRGEGLMSRLTPHQWSAAMRRLDRAPPMRAIFNPQKFYAYNARLAYTSCGSFVRFYRQEHGVEALNQLYAQGGERPGLDEVIGEWESWLDQRELSERLIKTASSMFGGRSIFYKVCAHELAARRNAAREVAQSGDLEGALKLWRAVEHDAPGDPRALRERISLLIQLERFTEASDLIDRSLKQALADDEQLDYLTRLRLDEWSADLDYWLGQSSGAVDSRRDGIERERYGERYADQLKLGMDRSRWRRLAVKRYALLPSTPAELGALVFKLFQTRQTSEERVESLSEALTRWPQSAELAYLKARAIMIKDPQEAERLLQRSMELKLSHPSLTYEALRLTARMTFDDERYDKAASLYRSLAQRHDLMIEEGERSELELWSRRAQHFALRHTSSSLP